MQIEHDKLKSENLNIMSALREKTRKQQTTQELYDRLKRKEMSAATQSAAFDTADELLNAGQGGNQHFPPGLYGDGQMGNDDSQDSVPSMHNGQMRSMTPPHHCFGSHYGIQAQCASKYPIHSGS